MRAMLVDRGLLLAFVVLYLLYALWGLSSLVNGTIPIRDISGDEGELIWAGCVAGLSLGLSAAVLLKAERVEVVLTIAWLFSVSLYPLSVLVGYAQGIYATPNIIFVAMSYLVFPIWRLIFLVRRINKRTHEARGEGR